MLFHTLPRNLIDFFVRSRANYNNSHSRFSPAQKIDDAQSRVFEFDFEQAGQICPGFVSKRFSISTL